MKLIATAGTEILELGDNFDSESAYQFILENDSDPENNPWLEGYDLILIDGDTQYIFEADCWLEIL